MLLFGSTCVLVPVAASGQASDAARKIIASDPRDAAAVDDVQDATPNGFVYGDGKTNNYWVGGFIDRDHTMRWNARLNAPATFKNTVKSSRTAPADGGTFNLQIGKKRLHGKTKIDGPAGTTSSQDAGQEAVGALGARGMGDSHAVLVADLGDASFPAGDLPIDFVPDEVKGKGINLFEINLTPETR